MSRKRVRPLDGPLVSNKHVKPNDLQYDLQQLDERQLNVIYNLLFDSSIKSFIETDYDGTAGKCDNEYICKETVFYRERSVPCFKKMTLKQCKICGCGPDIITSSILITKHVDNTNGLKLYYSNAEWSLFPLSTSTNELYLNDHYYCSPCINTMKLFLEANRYSQGQVLLTIRTVIGSKLLHVVPIPGITNVIVDYIDI